MSDASIRRLVAERHWETLHPGIYCCAPPSQQSWMWGGLLYGGAFAALTSTWALHAHGLCQLPDWPVTVVSPARRRSTDRWRLTRRDRVLSSGEPSRVSVAVALVDAWAQLDEREFMTLASEALFKRRTSVATLSEEHSKRSRIPRRKEFEIVLDELAAGARSPLESDYLRLVERPHHLPKGVRQASVGGRSLDVLYEDYGLVIETDGRLGHAGSAWRDMARDNSNVELGLVTLRFGARDVRRDPCGVARQVARVLAQLGWRGELISCRRCRRER